MKNRVLHYDSLNEFEFFLSYNENMASNAEIDLDSHMHNQCEIYINVSGDVSFMVENEIYPIASGNVIITRPEEYHHCIYHSDELHKHYWILFSAKGNERICERFFDRKLGEKNLIVFAPEIALQLIKLCGKMLAYEYTSDFERYFDFFRLLSIINSGTAEKNEHVYPDYIPSELIPAIRLINSEFQENISNVY